MGGAPQAARAVNSYAIPFFRDLGTIVPFSANNKQSKELSRGMVWRELYLRLTGQLTLASTDNIPADTAIGDEWSLVQDITIRLNGRDVMKRISGPALRWLDYYLYGYFPRKALGQIGDGATTNPSFDSTLIIPFWMPKSQHPMDFAFDTSKVAKLDIEINWTNYNTVNANATGFTTPPQIACSVYEVANVTGAFARWNIFELSNVVAGATDKYQIKVPVGYLYRSFLVHDVNEIITNWYLESHPTEWLNLPTQIVRDVLGVDRRSSIVPGAFANTYYLAGAPGDDLNHFMYFDSAGHGANVESIDAFGLSEFYLEFDTSGAGTINVYPNQLVVPRG